VEIETAGGVLSLLMTTVYERVAAVSVARTSIVFDPPARVTDPTVQLVSGGVSPHRRRRFCCAIPRPSGRCCPKRCGERRRASCVYVGVLAGVVIVTEGRGRVHT